MEFSLHHSLLFNVTVYPVDPALPIVSLKEIIKATPTDRYSRARCIQSLNNPVERYYLLPCLFSPLYFNTCSSVMSLIKCTLFLIPSHMDDSPEMIISHGRKFEENYLFILLNFGFIFILN